MVASHVGESGEYGEFLLNRQMYVNQFHKWWPAMLANLANMAISANSCQIGKCMSISSIPRLPAILANLAISANMANAANSCQRGLLFKETNYLPLKQQGTTSQ